MNKEDIFADVELETPSNTDTGTKDVVQSPVSVTNIEWNDYVLGHFADNEMFDGRPLCAGLRRVAELLLGRIVSSRPTQIFPPSNNGEEIGRATVVWEVVFEDGSVFSDVADAWEGNTDDTFCVFNTATAATRAEGRALRKALRLKTVAAEEMTTKDTAKVVKTMSKTNVVQKAGSEYNAADRITQAQLGFINTLAERANIDAEKLFKEVLEITGNPTKVTKAEAHLAIEKLNEYQQDKSSVPSSILGYDSNWRN